MPNDNKKTGNNSNSDKTSPVGNSSASFKRRSTNISQNHNNSNKRDELKFIHVAKRSEEHDHNFRKTKSSIGDKKNINVELGNTKQLKPKTSNPDKILDSIIQSRCLTKEKEQIDILYAQEAYGDIIEKDVLSNDSKIRKSMSNQDNDDKGVLEKRYLKEEKKDNKDKGNEDDIDKPWISYLRNLRIPMMCQLHRKITLAISDNSLKATPTHNKKRDKSPVSLKKRNLNRNPN